MRNRVERSRRDRGRFPNGGKIGERVAPTRRGGKETYQRRNDDHEGQD